MNIEIKELDDLVQKMDELSFKITVLMGALTGSESYDLMKPKDIAARLGISVQNLYSSQRYYMPNFGEEAVLAWPEAQVVAWLSKGPKKLKEEWEKHKLEKAGAAIRESAEKQKEQVEYEESVKALKEKR